MTWDAENRLIKAVVNGTTIKYSYDYQGRRIAKTVVGSPDVTTHFIYEGWNLCAEYTGTTLEKTDTWGMDLSGSMQGAGGVGGLLMVTEDPGGTSEAYYYPTYDGNGNVSEYLDGSGVSQAHYEYDGFGNLAITATGSKADDFAHRFSTKYHDAETGFYYYGYRYYDPVTGRWPSRDPIEETGGINLYGMVRNDAIGSWDYLGLQDLAKIPVGGICGSGKCCYADSTVEGGKVCKKPAEKICKCITSRVIMKSFNRKLLVLKDWFTKEVKDGATIGVLNTYQGAHLRLKVDWTGVSKDCQCLKKLSYAQGTSILIKWKWKRPWDKEWGPERETSAAGAYTNGVSSWRSWAGGGQSPKLAPSGQDLPAHATGKIEARVEAGGELCKKFTITVK